MKRKTLSALLALAFVVSLSGSAFAGEGQFAVLSDATVKGKALTPGKYNVSWNKEGLARIVNADGRVIEVQAEVVERAEKAKQTSILKRNDANGESQLIEVRFGGKKTVLLFDDSKVAQKQ